VIGSLMSWLQRINTHIKPSGPPFYAAQDQMSYSIKADSAAHQSIFDGCMNDLHVKTLQQSQNLHILPLASGPRSTF